MSIGSIGCRWARRLFKCRDLAIKLELGVGDDGFQGPNPFFQVAGTLQAGETCLQPLKVGLG